MRLRLPVLLLAILLPCVAHAVPVHDPSLRWRELETRHLRLHFPARLSLFATEVSRAAESAFARLSTLYGFDPGRTSMVLWDSNERTNGAALAARNEVVLYGSAGTLLLRGWHPWIANVATHEFSHIFSLHNARVLPPQVPGISMGVLARYDRLPDGGFAKGGGSFYLSAESVPRWFAEGIAQFDASQAGFDSFDSTRRRLLRAALLARQEVRWTGLETTRGKSEIGAELVYNEGFAFVRWLAGQYGELFLADLTRQPALHNDLNFNRGIQRLTGLSGAQLFGRFLDNQRQALTATTVSRLPAGFSAGISDVESLLPGKRILTKGRFTRALLYGKGDKIALVGSGTSVYDNGNLYVASGTNPTGKDLKQVARAVLGRPAWGHDGSLWYCSPGQPDFRGYAFSHLYEIRDINHPHPQVMVRNLRCLDLIALPTGDLVATVNENGTLNLVKIETTHSTTSPVIIPLTTLAPPLAADQPARGANHVLYFIFHKGTESDLASLSLSSPTAGFRYLPWPGSEERSPVWSDNKLWWLSDREDTLLDLWRGETTQAVRLTSTPAGLVSTFASRISDEVGIIAYRHEDFHPRILHTTTVQQRAPATWQWQSWPDDILATTLPSESSRFHFAKPLFIPELLYEYDDMKVGATTVFGDEIGLWQGEVEALAGVDADISLAGSWNGWYLPIEFRYDYYRRHRTIDLPDLGMPYRQRNVYHSGELSTFLSINRHNTVYSSLSAGRFELLFPAPSPLTWQNIAWDNRLIFQNIPPSPEADVNPRGGYLTTTRLRLARSFSAEGLFPEAGVVDYLQIGMMGRGFWGLGDRLTVEAGLQGDMIVGWNPGKGRPVIPNVAALDELFLGGEFFSLRRGLFQSYKGFAGYDEFAVSGEWMTLADIVVRWTLGRRLWSAGPFYLDGLYLELGSGIGRAWPTGTGWLPIRKRVTGKSRLFVDPASLAAAAAGDRAALLHDAGFLAETSIALRSKMVLWGAFPWNSYLKLARGWQDPGVLGYRYDEALQKVVQGPKPPLPFRIYVGVGTGF